MTPNPCILAESCSGSPLCQFGSCSQFPPFGQGIVGVDDAAEVGLCVAQPEVCAAVIIGIGVIELIRVIHMSQHGKGNVSDTGITKEAQDIIRAGLATGICEALQILENAAKSVGDSAKLRKIRATQKQFGCVGSRQSR